MYKYQQKLIKKLAKFIEEEEIEILTWEQIERLEGNLLPLDYV